MEADRNRRIIIFAVIAGILVAAILVLGTIWMGHQAQKDAEEAVHSVSLFYLDELAGRREQVVENNLNQLIKNMYVATGLMTEEDLSDQEHLQAFQSRMKQLYNLEKFAFIDTDGVIYTAMGIRMDIDKYPIDYKSITEPEISVLNPKAVEKNVIIAIPVDMDFDGKHFCACFNEINMENMLQGVSLQNDTNGSTFCNIYTSDGIALSNTVLGGLAVEDNLLEALQHADYDEGYSYEMVEQDFKDGIKGQVSFTYNDIQETLSYIPIEGTDWMLTYLIRESVISERISSVSNGVLTRSVFQSIIIILVLMAMFLFFMVQTRKNARMLLEKETAEAEARARQQELEEKLKLQEKLLEEEQQRVDAENLITAMASDYRNVYHVNLDEDDAVCYRADPDDPDQHPEGEHFAFYEAFRGYGERFVAEEYRDGFQEFIKPENIRNALSDARLISYRYLCRRRGREYYEMLRMAGVRHPEDRKDHKIHALGVGFTVVDTEMREDMARNQALSEALETAEQANRAKTAFLSNMSHEIRTPMNAIIGLDNIALNDPDTPEKTRDYLRKIGDSADHLLHLINDILDMSRIESGRMILKNEEFSFPRLLESINTILSGQCQEKGLDYQCHINSEVDDYYIGDGMKLRQVLINIIGNAVKFTPPGGKVELDIKRESSFGGQTMLSFKISDTGIGMSEEFLPHIFDTFAQEDSSTTNKYGSSGLGMAITKNIVEMMNGNIEVSSVKGEGSTFLVTVTLANSSRSGAEDGSVEVRPDEMSVLVIDDDPIACEHAKLILSKAGIATDIAASGAEGIEMVRLRHARREPYNLILVDWKMPEMDGVETTREIRAITGDESAIIILTAYKWDDVLEEAMEAGVDSFISKPLFAAALLEEFKSALKRKNLAGENAITKAELSGRRVLLAEDMQINAEIILMVLNMRQVEADLAENGKIAVDMFRDHPEGYYDAILMDMRMPEMDGLEATRHIRAMDRPDAKTIPIIALTANAFDEDVQRSLQAGLNAHLTKPVQPDALFETLETLIED